MKHLRLTMTLIVASGALASLALAEDDKEVEARKTALEMAGAFSNDGFKIRDGHWAGTIKNGDRAVVAVNLYAGNEYWFSAAGAENGRCTVRLHDESGQPLATEDYKDEQKAAAGFAPTVSGQYFVSIAPDEGGAGTYCLVYSYK